MKKKYLYIIFIIASVACKKEDNTSRSFYMGFTPWLYDNTIEAQQWTYTNINQYGDIISEHLEEGIPWNESYSNIPFPQELIDEIESRLLLKDFDDKVLLQISPLNISRNGLALYRGSLPNQVLPDDWRILPLNDIKVKTAYFNYAKRMVDYFSPDYLIVGVESNLIIRNNFAIWNDYVDLQKFIYTELKKVYPSLQISVSFFCVPFFPEWSSGDNLDLQTKGLRDIEPYVDFISFSVHPFMSGLLAESFPANYFDRLFSFTRKPIAISESSYPAQVWQTISEPIIEFNGSPVKQAGFIELLLRKSDERNAKFVIWFSIRDYDALWEHLLNKDPLALVWRDTGLFDENGNKREGLIVWEKWYNIPK